MSQPILYLAHRVPYPPDKGDRIRNWNVLRFVARRRPVFLACFADEPVSDETRRVLNDTCAEVGVVPIGRARWLHSARFLLIGRSISEGAFASSAMRQLLDDWTREHQFAAAIASASSLAPYLRQSQFRSIPAIIDLVDVDSQKFFDYAQASSFPRSWLYRLEGRRLRNVERELPAWAKAVMVVSAAETELYRGFAKPGAIHTVTNGVDLDYFQPQSVLQEPACTFVGALDYKPNVDAACWFAESVWPELRRLRPELAFRIVGRQPTQAVRQLATIPGVEVVGSVPDVRPWVAKSAVIVVPLRIARGVQNKVLEALAMAKPCVASPMALNGLNAKHDEQLLCANSPAEWIDSVIKLLDDERLRRRLGAAGRAYVEQHHTWERCLEPLAEIIESK